MDSSALNLRHSLCPLFPCLTPSIPSPFWHVDVNVRYGDSLKAGIVSVCVFVGLGGGITAN